MNYNLFEFLRCKMDFCSLQVYLYVYLYVYFKIDVYHYISQNDFFFNISQNDFFLLYISK